MRVSQPRHCWHFGWNNSLSQAAVLYTVQAHEMPVAPCPSSVAAKNVSGHCQMSPGSGRKGGRQNHSNLKTTVLDRNKRKQRKSKWDERISNPDPRTNRPEATLWCERFEDIPTQCFSNTEDLDLCTNMFLKARACRETHTRMPRLSPHAGPNAVCSRKNEEYVDGHSGTLCGNELCPQQWGCIS